MRTITILCTAVALLHAAAAAEQPASEQQAEKDKPEPPGAAVARAAVNEARELVSAGKPKQAQKHLKTVLEELRAVPSSEEAQADVFGQLGIVYTRLAKEVEAVGAFENAAELLFATFGGADPRVSIAADRLADALVKSGDPGGAYPMYRRMLDAMQDGLGISHPGYQTTLRKLADTANAAGKPKVAVKALRELLHAMSQAPPQMQSAAEEARVRVQLSTTLAKGGGKLSEALEQAETAVKVHEKLAKGGGAGAGGDGAGGGPPQAASPFADLEHAYAVNAVAGILEKLDRDDEAVATMRRATEMAVNGGRAADDPKIVQAQKNLRGLEAHVARKKTRREAAGQSKSEL